jgi:Flp pilus assembly protein TadD
MLQGTWRPDTPIELLAERVVSREEVAAALANRALLREDVIEPSTMNSLTEQAVALLENDERTAAAALFDAARTLKPSDMSAQNNFAFCVLLDKPEEARKLLIDALEKNVENAPVTQ